MRRMYVIYIVCVAVLLLASCGNPGAEESGPPESMAAMLNPGDAYHDYESLDNEFRGWSIGDIFLRADSLYRADNSSEKAIRMFRLVVSRYSDEIPDSEKIDCATAWTCLGWYYLFDRKNPTQAYPMFRYALDIAGKYDKDGMLTCSILTNLGEIYISFDDEVNAMTNYKKAFSTALEYDNRHALEFSYMDLLHFAWLSGNLDRIESESAVMASLDGDFGKAGRYASVMNGACRALTSGEARRAAELADSARSLLPGMNGRARYEAENCLMTAMACRRAGELSRMDSILTLAERTVEAEDISSLTHLLHALRKDYYAAAGDTDSARVCESRHLFVRDSLFNSRKYGSIRDMEATWQASKFEFDLRNSRNETRRHLWLNIFLGACILAIALLAYKLVVKNSSLRQKNDILFSKNLELMDIQRLHAHPGVEGDPAGDDGSDSLREPESGDDGKVGEEEPESGPDDAGKGEPPCQDGRSEEMTRVFSEVRDAVAGSREIFDPGFSVDSLVALTGIKGKLISQSINTVTGKNFGAFLAEYRISEACRLLLDCKGGMRPTIEYVAESVGYRSRTHFSKVFKSVTGLTTTEFIQRANDRNFRQR